MTFNDLKFETINRFGKQAKHTFPNGYGVSVVQGPYTYGGQSGKYELAVIGPDGKLDYTTPITDDVIGWLPEEMVTVFLHRIEALPSK